MQQKNSIVTCYYNTFKIAKKRVLIEIETTFPNRDSRVVKYTLGNAVFFIKEDDNKLHNKRELCR